MLWFTVWTVLVLATLAGAFVLGLSLWRKGRALVAEVERAAAVLERLADRADELTAGAAALPAHDLLTDPEQHRRHLAEIRARRDERRGQRAARRTGTFARWQALSR